MSIQHKLTTSIMAAALLLFGAATASAGPVTVGFLFDTSSLVGNGPFSLVFQLADGSGTGDANNTVVLSDFNFFGGSTGSTADFLAGGASGSLSSVVTLTDSDPFFNGMFQSFTPGAELEFSATFTNNADIGPFNDMFTLSLLDSGLNGVPTLDPSGNETLITVTLDGTLQAAPGNPYVLAPPMGLFGTDTSQTQYNVPAADVVPEPGTLMLLGTGLAALGLRLRRQK